MKAYECGKETEHYFTARFISDPKELHPTLKKINLHSFKTAVKPKKDKKGKYSSNRKLFTRLIILVKQGRVKLQAVHTYILGPVSYALASSDGFLAKMPESVIVDLVQSNWPELCSCVVCENDSETVIEVELVNDVSDDDDDSNDNQFVAS